MPFSIKKIHYTFYEYTIKLEKIEIIKRSIKKILFGKYGKYFIYPIIGNLDIDKISLYHLRKLFLYFQGNGLTISEKKALITSINYVFSKAIEYTKIKVNYLEIALQKFNPYLEFTCLKDLSLLDKKYLQKLNYEGLYKNHKSLFNKPNFLEKHEEYSVSLYGYLSNVFKNNKKDRYEISKNNISFIDAFIEYVELEFRVGKKYHNTHINIFYLYLFPALKEKRLIEIDEIDIKIFEIILRIRTIEEYTISFYLNNLKKFFEYSLKNGYLKFNPFLNYTKNKLPIYNRQDNCLIKSTQIKEKYALSREELKFIVSYMRGSKFEPVIGLLIIYGLRIGEVLGLKETSIDYKLGVITIDSQISNKEFKEHTKTYKVRKLLISKAAKYYLDILIERNREYKQNNLLYNNPYKLLITDELGETLPLTAMVNYLKKIGKLINNPALTFHTFRHTFVSIASEINASLTKTKEEIGHSSIFTTMNVYLHSTEVSRKLTQDKACKYFQVLLGEYNYDEYNSILIRNKSLKNNNGFFLNDDLLSENNEWHSFNLTFEKYSEQYIGIFKNENKDKANALRKALKPYYQYFGFKDIREINRVDILKANRDFFNSNIKNKTINYRLWGLKKIFSIAYNEGLISNNPLESIDALKQNIFYKPYYNDEEIKKILENASVTKYGNGYALSLVTGLEAKFLLALNYEDIDLENKIIRINKYLERGKREDLKLIIIPEEKVYINELGCNYLKKEIRNKSLDNYPLFVNQNKDRVSIDNFRDVFKRFSKKININYYSIDTLVYTFGIVSFKSDAPVSEVIKILGKTKGKIVYENKNMYGKFSESQASINDYFDKIFGFN